MKEQELYAKLIEVHGDSHQVSVAVGELGELVNELSKVLRGVPNNMHICEEIADVEIVLSQLKTMYDPTGKRVKLFKTFKLQRLLEYYINGGCK